MNRYEAEKIIDIIRNLTDPDDIEEEYEYERTQFGASGNIIEDLPVLRSEPVEPFSMSPGAIHRIVSEGASIQDVFKDTFLKVWGSSPDTCDECLLAIGPAKNMLGGESTTFDVFRTGTAKRFRVDSVSKPDVWATGGLGFHFGGPIQMGNTHLAAGTTLCIHFKLVLP
jgi:hypothetical protein